MDRGDCSRIVDGDGDSVPIREKDLNAPSAYGYNRARD
jgi:hypothetical protein